MKFICEVKTNSNQYMAIYYLDHNEVSGDKKYLLSSSTFRKEVTEEFERGERRIEPDKYHNEALFATAQEAIYVATCIQLTNKLEHIQKIISGTVDKCALPDTVDMYHPYAFCNWMDLAFGYDESEMINRIKTGGKL